MQRPANTAPASGPTITAPPARERRTLRRYTEEQVDEIVARYLRGDSTLKIERELGIPVRTVGYHLKRRGIERRPTSVPHKHPARTLRTCEREGCQNLHAPTGYQVTNGEGRFCSRECGYVARRVAEPRERTCPNCGFTFTPWPHEVDREFCNPSCRQSFNWKDGRPAARGLVEWWKAEGMHGRARQRRLGGWEGGKYGDLGGRERVTVTPQQRANIKMASRYWGRRKIASKFGLSEWAVRVVLDELDEHAP
jgi:hypothetical protein